MRTRVKASAVTMVMALVAFGTLSAAAAKPAPTRLRVIDRTTSVARKSKPKAFATVTGERAVAVGDTVKTGPTGFAEVRYPDGSVTRLDSKTNFTVESLASQSVKTALHEGEVWNEVEKATGSSTKFEVDTANAVATVRGTAFAVGCASDASCVFAVVDGTVDVTANGQTVSVTAGQQTSVDAAGVVSAAVPLTATVWIQQNQDQDRADGRTPPASPGAGSVGGFVEQATGSSPRAIAATILEEHNASAATPAPDSIIASARTVTCPGSKPLRAGDRVLCTATVAGGETYLVRAVALDDAGKISVTSNQSPIDTSKMEATAKILGEQDPASGQKISDITSAKCAGGPVAVVALPGGTVACHLVDAEGRSIDAVYRFDGAGRATSSGTFQ